MRKILVASGKGGAGKTTVSINLSSALNKLGHDVTLVDCNFTTPNIGLYFGITKIEKSIHDILSAKSSNISDAVYLHKSGAKIVPGNISLGSLNKINPQYLNKKLKRLSSDFVILDSSAGLGREAMSSLAACDEVLVVVNPELPSVVDGLKVVELARKSNKEIIGAVINRQKGKLEMKTSKIESILEVPVITIIPEDEHVKKALVRSNSVYDLYPNSKSSIAYRKLAHYVTGDVFYEEKKNILKDFVDLFRLG
ncbi:cell division ATPase MinD [Candidatus Woesearchaeota archaeon]|nr:cell division ATPase MinD [Candidatus Woesearchaeota archaeon]